MILFQSTDSIRILAQAFLALKFCWTMVLEIASLSPWSFVASIVTFLCIAVVLKWYLSQEAPGQLSLTAPLVLRLETKHELTHNVIRLRFSLPNPKRRFGLPPGQHVSLQYKDAKSRLVSRLYTPTSSDQDIGVVEFIIKVYRANEDPRYPEGGRMSQYLDQMKIGDTIECKGPKGSLVYKGNGLFEVGKGKKKCERRVKHLGLIAGGTGITPMLQLINAALRNPKDLTNFYLIFANQSENDILLRDELDALAKKNPQRLQVWYIIDRQTLPMDWCFSTGFINADVIKDHLPAPGGVAADLFGDEVFILVCGPPPMLQYAVGPALNSLGVNEDMTHFEGTSSFKIIRVNSRTDDVFDNPEPPPRWGLIRSISWRF